MLAFVASDQGVLHFDCLAAKYAEAFFGSVEFYVG